MSGYGYIWTFQGLRHNVRSFPYNGIGGVRDNRLASTKSAVPTNLVDAAIS